MSTFARTTIAVAALGFAACGQGEAPQAEPVARDAGSPLEADTVASGAVPDAEVGRWAMPPLSGEGSGEVRGNATLRAVRSARHDGYDRIVFEFEGRLPAWDIRSVANPTQCGSGHSVDPGGAYALELDFRSAVAHTEEGQPTVQERNRQPGLPALRTARLTCDFEGIVSWVLGVEHQGELRALELGSPARLAVDIRHR